MKKVEILTLNIRMFRSQNKKRFEGIFGQKLEGNYLIISLLLWSISEKIKQYWWTSFPFNKLIRFHDCYAYRYSWNDKPRSHTEGHSSATWCYMANASMWCLPTIVQKEWFVGFHYTGYPLIWYFQIPCVFPVQSQIFPVPIHIICEYNIHKTDLAELYIIQLLEKKWFFLRQLSQYPLLLESEHLQLELTKFPVFSLCLDKIPCVLTKFSKFPVFGLTGIFCCCHFPCFPCALGTLHTINHHGGTRPGRDALHVTHLPFEPVVIQDLLPTVLVQLRHGFLKTREDKPWTQGK